MFCSYFDWIDPWNKLKIGIKFRTNYLDVFIENIYGNKPQGRQPVFLFWEKILQHFWEKSGMQHPVFYFLSLLCSLDQFENRNPCNPWSGSSGFKTNVCDVTLWTLKTEASHPVSIHGWEKSRPWTMDKKLRDNSKPQKLGQLLVATCSSTMVLATDSGSSTFRFLYRGGKKSLMVVRRMRRGRTTNLNESQMRAIRLVEKLPVNYLALSLGLY